MSSLLVSAFAGLILASGGDGPTDEMFNSLRNAPNEDIASSFAEDIELAQRESGSATADILLERALIAEAMQDLDLARAFLDRAIAVSPEFAEAWFRRALLFISDEAYDQALYDLNEALTHEPRHFNAWLILASLFEQLGQPGEALNAYREVLLIHPHHEIANAQIRRLAPQVDGRAI